MARPQTHLFEGTALLAPPTEEFERNRAARLAQEDFGDWLAHVRSGRRVSQADMARTTGLSPQLISNVEKGHRRATDNYLKKAANALGHDGGWKHMREIRDYFHAQRMSQFLAEFVPALLESGVAEESAQVQSLLHEARLHLNRVEEHGPIIRSYLVALGEGRKGTWDPDVVRTELAKQPVTQVSPADSRTSDGQPEQAAPPERLELLVELVREAEQLPTAQLMRVLGFIAALPRG